MRHILSPVLFAFALLGSAESGRAEATTYGTVYLHSWHLGTEELNDVTPGLTFGRRWASDTSSLELHIEGGIFHNSYEEISPITLGGVSVAVAQVGSGEIRLGASVGIARYDELSRHLQEHYGIPNAGGFIPLVGATASYRVGKTDIRMTTVPPGEGVDAILNLSFARSF